MTSPHHLPVLAAVDGSDDSRRALEWALAEATRRDTGLRVVHVRQYAPLVRAEVLVAGLVEEEDENDTVLAELRKDLEPREGLPPLEFISRTGMPAPLLTELTEDAQLLVLGSRGRGGFASLLLGSNGVAAARDAACPVVVVPRPGREVHGDADIAPGPRVVVGLKTDDPDRAALAFAFAHAARTGARVQAVAAYPWPVLAWTAYGDFSPAAINQDVLEADTLRLAQEALAPHQESNPKVEVEVLALPGDSAGHLVAHSREADLVVVGRHRRTLTHPAPMLGSVTQAVLLHAASPVAVVPPEGD